MPTSDILPLDTSSQRLPIHVITGFLGSGKTTLLNHLLHQDEMQNTAVIVNEFGEISIDHLLVQTSTEDIMRLAGGCLCCSVRTDLVKTLEYLYQQRQDKTVDKFQRVVIETSGLADPAPILRTLLDDEFVSQYFRLENVITTVDAVYGATQLKEHEESVKQAALAHHLLLTKTDLQDDAKALDALQQRLRQLNPAAKHYDLHQGIPDVETLFHERVLKAEQQALAQWLQSDAYKNSDEHHHHHHHEHISHERYIHSFCFEYDAPLPWKTLEHWLQQLTRLRGKDLLRVKGIVYTQETELPVIIQGVQHIFQAPSTLSSWPDAGHKHTQIVFITRNISQSLIKQSLETLLKCKTPAEICQAAMLLL